MTCTKINGMKGIHCTKAKYKIKFNYGREADKNEREIYEESKSFPISHALHLSNRGLIAVVFSFLLFGVIQTPDGPFIRPHPGENEYLKRS